jgi:hypothetical protein
MPVNAKRDSKGCYAQWGDSGAKYYYRCGDEADKSRAIKLANKQGRAAYASGYREPKKT